MKLQEVPQNRRISSLTQLTRELEQSRSPDQTVQALQRAFAEADGFIPSLMLSTRGLKPCQYRVVQMQLNANTEPHLFSHNMQKPPGPVHHGGILGHLIRRHQPQLLQNTDWASDPFFYDVLRPYTSVMAIPLTGDRLPMQWMILLKSAPERFTVDELEATVERIALICALLENQLLADDLARAHEQIDRDARQVGELQRALLPAAIPQIAGLEIAASYEPSGRAGGDVYDFFPLSGGRWCVLVGDASGHGLAAAVVMAIVQAVLHAHPENVDGPASLLTYANRQLCKKKIGGFFTSFLGVFDPQSRLLTYANAGHPAPFLKRAGNGSVDVLDAMAGFPLGIDEAEVFKQAAVQLGAQDMLLLYTDGITETRDPAKDWFDQERLLRAFRNTPENRPAELIKQLHDAVHAFEAGQLAQDDQTLVAARVL